MKMEKNMRWCMWVLSLMMLGLMMSPVNGISCGDAVSALIPCGSYLLGAGGAKPSTECCQSAQGLNKLATNTATRQALCECLKQTGPSFGVKPERAKQLPSLCKLSLDIPISPNVNCKNVK